jgi:hypothetical protein
MNMAVISISQIGAPSFETLAPNVWVKAAQTALALAIAFLLIGYAALLALFAIDPSLLVWQQVGIGTFFVFLMTIFVREAFRYIVKLWRRPH